jgi:hypothetical protein
MHLIEHCFILVILFDWITLKNEYQASNYYQGWTA